MKKIVCLTLFIVLASALVSGGGKKEKGDTGTTSASKNKIVIYTSMYENTIAEIQQKVSQQFPNVQIEFVYGGTGKLEAIIETERASNKLGCDILMVADPAYSIELKERGILHSYKSKEAANLAFDYDPQGYWYPVRVSNMVLAFNPARTARASVPHSFNDFSRDTRMRGLLSMSNPFTSGTCMAAITALRDTYGYAYFDALGRQRTVIEPSATALEKLEKGQYRIVMVLEELVLKKRQQDKSRLEVIYPTDGTIMIPSPIMIINNKWSANKNAKTAEAIADWFLSNEGQATIVDEWMHSVRADFDKPPFNARPTNEIKANRMPVNWEHVYKERDPIRTYFSEHVTHRR